MEQPIYQPMMGLAGDDPESLADEQQQESSDRQTRLITYMSRFTVCTILPLSLAALLATSNHSRCSAQSSTRDFRCMLNPISLWSYSPLHTLSGDTICPANTVACGNKCLPGSLGAHCCLSSLGKDSGILCGPKSICCNGLCFANGTGCSATCSPGMVKCGSECLVGTSSSTCCVGKTGLGMVCGPNAQCCDGICAVKGTGCSKKCNAGMVSCGGLCLVGDARSQCCLGPSGRGILCGPYARCVNGLCLAANGEGNGTCHPGMVPCGGHCLVGNPGDRCCLGPSGKGIVCGPYARCQKGVCLAANGQGNGTCPPKMVPCGGHCLVGNPEDKCCEGPTGKGIICGPYARCTKDGVCLAANGVDGSCPPGMVSCGGHCLVGTSTSQCCLGPSGRGVICGEYARCSKDGLCLAANGLNNGTCPPGMIPCGKHCLVGTPEDKCCLGPSGLGIVCGPYARCGESGVCFAPNGKQGKCHPGMVPCGGHCLVGSAKDQCCMGISGIGIICGPYARCQNGVCLAANGQGNGTCPSSEVPCGRHCLAGTPQDTCCVGPTGDGIICGPWARCVKGVCLAANGQGNGTCRPGMVPCGKHCLVGNPEDQCCLGPTGVGIICGPRGRCQKDGLCLAP